LCILELWILVILNGSKRVNLQNENILTDSLDYFLTYEITKIQNKTNYALCLLPTRLCPVNILIIFLSVKG
jgi:hypothetical protein